jgi:hypothetical protein
VVSQARPGYKCPSSTIQVLKGWHTFLYLGYELQGCGSYILIFFSPKYLSKIESIIRFTKDMNYKLYTYPE